MNPRPLFSLALLLLLVTPLAQAQNLVVNPGFETGDFTGYTITPAVASSNISVGTNQPGAGSYGADFRASNPVDPDRIAQTVSTIAGQLYNFSFFLRINPVFAGGFPNNSFAAFFNGVQVYSSFASNGGFTTFTFNNLLATTNFTPIEFRGANFLGLTVLDSVSVTAVNPNGPAPVPESGSSLLLLAISGVAFFGSVRLRTMWANLARGSGPS